MQYTCAESYLEELCGGNIPRTCLELVACLQLQLMGANNKSTLPPIYWDSLAGAFATRGHAYLLAC